MQGEGFGYSPEQRQQMWQQTQEDIGQQVQQGTASHLQNMQSRGILGSDVTAQGLGNIARQQSDSLARAGTQMDLQDQQMRQQGIQNAMGMGSQLAQMGQQQRQFDKNYGLQRDQFGHQQQQADRQYGLQRDQFDFNQEKWEDQFGLQQDQFDFQRGQAEYQQGRQQSADTFSNIGTGLMGGVTLGTKVGAAGGPIGATGGALLGGLGGLVSSLFS